MTNLFEIATRNAYTFPSKVGDINVLDLWKLKLKSATGASLDDTACRLSKEIKENSEESFVDDVSKDQEHLINKFDIVMHIIKFRKDEISKNEKAALVKAEKEKIMKLIEMKDEEDLSKLSKEELQAKLNNM